MSVLITGASSGIGEACAKAFAAAHHDLVLIARRKERLFGLAEQLAKTHSIQVTVLPCDIRSKETLDQLFREQSEILNQVDILINNAGLARGRDPIQSGHFEDWDEMVDTNLKGLLYITRSILPQMIKNKKGHIIHVGSVAGHWAYEAGNVYCATKAAVRLLTEAMRLDLQGTGVRVTEISPGMVQTEFSEVRFRGDKEKAESVYAGRSPLKASDIAEMILWCSQRPAHINIQELVVYPTEQASVHSYPRPKPSES